MIFKQCEQTESFNFCVEKHVPREIENFCSDLLQKRIT